MTFFKMYQYFCLQGIV